MHYSTHEMGCHVKKHRRAVSHNTAMFTHLNVPLLIIHRKGDGAFVVVSRAEFIAGTTCTPIDRCLDHLYKNFFHCFVP